MKAMEGEVGAIFADLEALKPLGFWYETPTVVFTSKTAWLHLPGELWSRCQPEPLLASLCR